MGGIIVGGGGFFGGDPLFELLGEEEFILAFTALASTWGVTMGAEILDDLLLRAPFLVLSPLIFLDILWLVFSRESGGLGFGESVRLVGFISSSR